MEDVPLISKKIEEAVDPVDLKEYIRFKRDMLKWFLCFGQTPDEAEGYTIGTVKSMTYIIDDFYRWIWSREGFTIEYTSSDLTSYMNEIAQSGKSTARKEIVQKVCKRLVKYWNHQWGSKIEWTPKRTFTTSSRRSKDYLTRVERSLIRDVGHRYESAPDYNSLSETERDLWKIKLSQRIGKPKDEIGPEEFTAVNSWKVASLVEVSLDAGLRPSEVETASVSWVDIGNQQLRFPKEDSKKNDDYWHTALTNSASQALEKWIKERSTREEYESTEALWLNREGNAYNKNSLRTLLHQLCSLADIPVENRSMSWYTIRRSTATYVAHDGTLTEAQEQLRHQDPRSTMEYDQVPIEARRDILENIE